eukprot:14843239-Alexandrium_andersonii.AAC.1
MLKHSSEFIKPKQPNDLGSPQRPAAGQSPRSDQDPGSASGRRPKKPRDVATLRTTAFTTMFRDFSK